MLIENQVVEVKWNGISKHHYIEKGYLYTKKGDSFSVKIEDLTIGSSVKVELMCDFCKRPFVRPYIRYNKQVKESSSLRIKHYDACAKRECGIKKSKLLPETKLTEQEKLEIIESYLQLIDLQSLQDKYQITERGIYKILDEYNIERKRAKWSEQHTEKIKSVYEDEVWSVILEELSPFGKDTIIHKAMELGLVKRKVFTEAELEILKTNYYTVPINELMNLLPNRTYLSIQTKANRLGLRKWEFWSDEDIVKLRELYSLYPNSRLIQFFKGRTENHITDKANELGLKKSSESNDIIKEEFRILLLDRLVEFSKELGRTPTAEEINNNKEMNGLSSYQRLFGGYMEACKLAGLEVNTQVFGKSFVSTSLNGDICLSKKEKEITDLFILNQIDYKKEALYRDVFPEGLVDKNIRCDWLVEDNIIVEYFGMPEKEYYRTRMEEKIELCKKNDVPFIDLYKKDFSFGCRGLIKKFKRFGIDIII